MLSVSPPLHKDFRGRRALCSPGDGWRSYVPPPLPTLQPAFHFLSSLLEQAVYVPVPVAPTPRIPMDASLNGSLERMMSLPLEVLDLIAAYVNEADSGPSLALASRFFNRMTMRHLLQDVQLTSHQSVVLLSRTLEEHPSLGQHIRRLSILVERPRWEQMDALATALGGYARCVDHLHLRFPSSDLHTAMPFLSCFSPESFDWVTSPCWMMRPAHLFAQFLSEWHRLRHLSFGNFRFDHVVVESIAGIASLETLTLKGNGSGHLDVDTLTSLLRLNAPVECSHAGADDRKRSIAVQVVDCPPTHRMLLLAGLQATFAADTPMLLSKLSWL